MRLLMLRYKEFLIFQQLVFQCFWGITLFLVDDFHSQNPMNLHQTNSIKQAATDSGLQQSHS